MPVRELVEPSRPSGIGLSAFILAAFALIAFIDTVVQLSSAPAPENSLRLFTAVFLLTVAALAIWSYWKGQEWSRILVLIASFLVAAREVSRMIDGENLVSLMSHPLLFLDFAMAIFLLYWLNTRPVRAWFKSASSAADLVDEHLKGKLCTAVFADITVPNQWHLAFEHDAELTLNCPWRIVLDDNLAFASNAAGESSIHADDDQPHQLMQNLRVKSVRVKPRTSDLFVAFEMGIELQSWSSDPSAHQWTFSAPVLTVIADAAGLKSQAITRISTEDPAEND